MLVKYALIQFHFINKENSETVLISFPFLHPLMKRFSEMCKLTPAKQQLVSGEMGEGHKL